MCVMQGGRAVAPHTLDAALWALCRRTFPTCADGGHPPDELISSSGAVDDAKTFIREDEAERQRFDRAEPTGSKDSKLPSAWDCWLPSTGLRRARPRLLMVPIYRLRSEGRIRSEPRRGLAHGFRVISAPSTLPHVRGDNQKRLKHQFAVQTHDR